MSDDMNCGWGNNGIDFYKEQTGISKLYIKTLPSENGSGKTDC